MSNIFGNGTDGDVTISSNTTLTEDMCYNNLTINNGITLTAVGYRIRVKETLLNNGTIYSTDLLGSWGVGGAGGARANRDGYPGTAGSASITEGNGAGGGGGGSGGGTNYSSWEHGGAGGVGGHGGRKRENLFLAAYTFNNQGVISTEGESGENGTNGEHGVEVEDSHYGSGGGGGGGGSGGNGGLLDLFYHTLTSLGTIVTNGGAGGNGGSGGGYYSQSRTGGLGGNGINGFGGQTNGSNGNSRGGGGAGGGSGNGTGGNGAAGGVGVDGKQYITDVTDYSLPWVTLATDPNFTNILNDTNCISESRCLDLEYFGSNNCEIYKIIDFNTDISNLIFNFSGSIKVLALAVGATVNFKYEWLDSANSVVSSHSIASLTATQDYTAATVLNATAPTNTEAIKIRFYISGNANARAFLENVSVTETNRYGIRIRDNTYKNTIKPEVITIISCGTVTMPNALNGDGTYGYDIDLPGTEAIPTSRIGVILLPHGNLTWEAFGAGLGWASGDPASTMRYIPCAYLDDDYSYYTKNDDTGVMTAFTPGVHTASTPITWDAIASIFPIYGWDRTSTNITSVRLWAATCYIILDGLSDFKAVYSIGNTGGITSVDYAVFIKEYNF